jgi:hypothetical protein
MGLLDGSLADKIKRLEQLTSPNQFGRGSKTNLDAIEKLRRNINMSKKPKRIKKSDLKKRYNT